MADINNICGNSTIPVPTEEESYNNMARPTDLAEDFSSLNLSDISPRKKSPKEPKRILHFSDGTLEEYSSDEDDEKQTLKAIEPAVDPKTLSWGPWMTYWASRTGKSFVSACDYAGEGIANALGITSPKYFYEIEEYKREMKEEEEKKKEENEQMSGWTSGIQEKQKPPDFEFVNLSLDETKVKNKF